MKNLRIALPVGVFLAAVALLLFMSSTVVAPAQGRGGPSIRWSVEKVSETMAAGSTKSITVRFQSRVDLTDVTLWLSPSLADFVSVKPASFAALSANQEQEVVLSLRVPGDAKDGEEGGTLQVKLGEPTIPAPLNINIRITARQN